MGSVHRDPRGKSKYWYAAFTLPDGRAAFRSTKETDKKKAQAVCSAFEQASENAKKNRLSEAQAKKVLDSILEIVGESPLKSITVKEFFLDWLKQKEKTTKPNTYIRYKGVVYEFLDHLAVSARLTLTNLNPRHIGAFKDAQIDKGVSASTVNYALKTIRGILDLARRQTIILSNPAEAVDNLNKVPNERKYFTNEQVEALMRVTDWEWQGMILLGFYAGMRLQDAAKLCWGNIDSKNQEIRYIPLKRQGHTNKHLEVPIHPTLWRYITSMPIQSYIKTAPLFPSLSLKKSGGAHGLSSHFGFLLKKAGIDRQEQTGKVKGSGRRFFGLSFHSLRHTCISSMANRNIAEEVRKQVVGHESDVHQQYTHIDKNNMRRAINVLPDIKFAT